MDIASRPSEEALPRLSGPDWVTLVTLMLSTFIVLLDSSVVFVALPAITADLGAMLDEATWVISAYILAFAVFLPPSASSATSTAGAGCSCSESRCSRWPPSRSLPSSSS